MPPFRHAWPDDSTLEPGGPKLEMQVSNRACLNGMGQGYENA